MDWRRREEKNRIENVGGACAIWMSIVIEYVCDILCIVVSMRRAVEGCRVSEGALEEDPIGDCQMSICQNLPHALPTLILPHTWQIGQGSRTRLVDQDKTVLTARF